MPCSVINSPSQMANIVPAVMVVSTDTVKSTLLPRPKPKPGMIS